ncbi:hypothetical protein RRG08_015471 [Elysia crispata]|uniref:Uncharacterized protein n=1 Tax=Elysia crispata TaxID=231223 RepID=A0AAE0YDL3_9GAST|nr:hypothetical protein RRG08_015471 [Elysia crispata]
MMRIGNSKRCFRKARGAVVNQHTFLTMVYHGTPVNLDIPTEPTTSGSNMSLQSQPDTMEAEKHVTLVIDATSSVENDYHYTEKCLNWQNNCSNTEVYQVLNKQPIILTATPNISTQKNINRTGNSLDNAHCLPSYQHEPSEPFIFEENRSMSNNLYEAEYASDFSSQEKLDQGSHCCSKEDALSFCDSHCSMLPTESPHRTRRDSEESEESMDTNSSLASSPYAYSVDSKFGETLSSINSASKLISEEQKRKNVNDLDHAYNKDSCANTDKAALVPTTKNEFIKFCTSETEPFFSHIEEADPEFVENPPVVTNNLIIVKDESFLYHSQTSLEQHPFENIPQANFLFRASTLPDLKACQRYQEEYGISWGYQDTRIFLSEDMLSRSMCSLSNSESLMMKYECSTGSSYGQRYPSRQLVDIDGNPIKVVPSSDHTTVMILLSLCVSILFVATDVIRNLQTSLHPKDGLGLTSLALIFAGYTLGSLLSTSLMQHIQPRVCLIISIIPNILFLLANLSSSLWLLAPISFLQGISMAIIWSVLSTYISYLASGRALSKGENIKVVCARFFNFFSLIYQSFLLLGNLTSSVLLKYGNSMHSMNSSFFSSSPSSEAAANDATVLPFPLLTKILISGNQSLLTSVNRSSTADFTKDSLINKGLCGANYHNLGHVIDAGDQWLHPNDGTIYMLHGTFIGCILVSLGMAVFGIESLNMNLFDLSASQQSPYMKSLSTTVKRSFKGMIHGCMALKFVLLLPLFMYSVMQFGFISAEVTAAFITCPVGINQIGFSMAFFAVGRFPTSFFCGFLTKKCGRLPLITLAASSPG